MKNNYEKHLTESARLTILKALNDETDLRMNDALLATVLDVFGFRKSRDWVCTQLRRLEELDAVTIDEIGTVMVATLTQAGLDHIERRALIEGIAAPSPEN